MVKLVFTNFGSQIFLSCLSDSLQRKRWEIPDADSNASSIVSGSLSSLGISAVQKKIDTEQKSTDARLNVSCAFTFNGIKHFSSTALQWDRTRDQKRSVKLGQLNDHRIFH